MVFQIACFFRLNAGIDFITFSPPVGEWSFKSCRLKSACCLAVSSSLRRRMQLSLFSSDNIIIICYIQHKYYSDADFSETKIWYSLSILYFCFTDNTKKPACFRTQAFIHILLQECRNFLNAFLTEMNIFSINNHARHTHNMIFCF